MPEVIDPGDHPATSLGPSIAMCAASLRSFSCSPVAVNRYIGSGGDAGGQQRFCRCRSNVGFIAVGGYPAKGGRAMTVGLNP
jgi:hypothetical protein